MGEKIKSRLELDEKARQAIVQGTDESLNKIRQLIERNGYSPSFTVLEFTLKNGRFEILNEFLKMPRVRNQFMERLLTKALDLNILHIFDKWWPEFRPNMEERKNNLPDEVEYLRVAEQELQTYSLECHPSFILLTKEDPIRYAIDQSCEVTRLLKKYPENKTELLDLSETCRKLASDLLDCCENSEEAGCLLLGKEAEPDYLSNLIDDNLIKFFTHPYSQRWLYNKWLGEEVQKSWKTKQMYQKVFYFVIHVLLYSYFSLFDIFVAKVDSPFNNFIHSVGSYMTFLTILMCSVFYKKINPTAEVAFNVLDNFAAFWIVSYLVQTMRNVFNPPYRNYHKSWWTGYELIMQALFILTGICYSIGTFLEEDDKLESLKWLLCAEGIYAVAIISAFMRILQWIHTSPDLGPVVISFSRMTNVIIDLMVIFVIVLFSFSFGLYKLYSGFRLGKSAVVLESNSSASTEETKEARFTGYRSTIKTLFWVMFGYGEPEYVLIPASYNWNAEEKLDITMIKQNFTMVIGYIMWALYHVAFIIVLLNMLIAIMTTSYERIKENTDEKWKLSRIKLFFYYMKRRNVVPPPFNLVEMVVDWIRRNNRNCCRYKNCNVENENEEKYQDLIEQLINRYLWKKWEDMKNHSDNVPSFTSSRKIHCKGTALLPEENSTSSLNVKCC